jgi:hypothetical protein
MRKLAAAAAFTVLCVVSLPGGTASVGEANAEGTEIAMYLSGDIRLEEIRGVSGVVVGPGCRLTVYGDVEVEGAFVSHGGEIRVYGGLCAGAVWLDSAEGGLRAQFGSVVARYYTQCGGDVKVKGSIVARADEDYDGLGLVNINCSFALAGGTSLTVGGGIFARGGDIAEGDFMPMDEAEWVSFASARGTKAGGYGDTPTGRGELVIRAMTDNK